MEKEGRTLNSHNNIPKPTLGRLPAYLRYLKSLPPECKTISATAIARALGLGEVQVRKDLGSTSGEGRPRVGYITGELITSIETCLGQNAMCKAVIVGAGKLGSALLDYEGFSVYGIEIAAAFDSRQENGSSLRRESLFTLWGTSQTSAVSRTSRWAL